MNIKIPLPIILAALCAALFFAVKPAKADYSARAVAAFAQSGLAGAVTGYVHGWKVAVSSSEQLVKPPTGSGVLWMECQAPQPSETGSAVLIAVGGADVDPTFATRKGVVFCGAGCNDTKARANAAGFFLQSASAVDVFCWAVTDRP